MVSFACFDEITPLSYSMILADPPWSFGLRSAKGKARSPAAHYSTMSFEALQALDVARLGQGDCLLFMRACWPSRPQALETMKAWGFRYVTGGSGHKLTRHGKSVFGTGYVLRSATEPFLIGTLGSPATARNVRNVIVEAIDGAGIDAERREHSRKPDCQYEIRERLVPTAARRIELFARTRRCGWDCWGNETDKFAADQVAA
ncbi:MT-A70 family methyltransferase [Novosphingopyxis sp. YJ-S2-01]|uniref:MT-A70 family methyltransferase n=1 Tax=Novosphingopyxis sp. YJ-S2-01 TaxID=2794021 RepID=UPI0018DCAF75|nr:MT-A70 family methyltransferase [Novosphingopyxis sp. YJ-S2-01]MBH9536905.1 DNA methyltransferase [Novosphingopyxis sp. YJ-S2-01]